MFKNQPKNLVEQPQNSDILKFHKMDDKNFGDAVDEWIFSRLIYALKCMTNKNQPKIQVEQPQNSVILSIILKILNNGISDTDYITYPYKCFVFATLFFKKINRQ